MTKLIRSDSILLALQEEGLLPSECYRITIEDDVNQGVVVIMFSCYMTDERLAAVSKATGHD